jgi:uncharacterized protein YndB with AHSA1/START domain
MLTWIQIILALLVIVVAATLVLASTKPDQFRVQRSTMINAPADKVFALINDFHNWPQWSPWEHRDPAMKRTHSGAASGVGAVYAWEGNKNVGQGRMEIMESSSPSKIVIKLEAMHGPSPFMTKVITVFMSMDSMVGKDFEAGLANLKAAAEK